MPTQYTSKILLPNLKLHNCIFLYDKNKWVENYKFTDLSSIPIDIDVCGIHDFWDANNQIEKIDNGIINRINTCCKHNNIKVIGYIYGNNTIGIYYIHKTKIKKD